VENRPMKFTIRELFLVTLVVAVCTAWWVDHQSVTRRNRHVEDALRTMNWRVTEDGELDTRSSTQARSPLYTAPAPNPPKP
jgi:hypothetical protein